MRAWTLTTPLPSSWTTASPPRKRKRDCLRMDQASMSRPRRTGFSTRPTSPHHLPFLNARARTTSTRSTRRVLCRLPMMQALIYMSLSLCLRSASTLLRCLGPERTRVAYQPSTGTLASSLTTCSRFLPLESALNPRRLRMRSRTRHLSRHTAHHHHHHLLRPRHRPLHQRQPPSSSRKCLHSPRPTRRWSTALSYRTLCTRIPFRWSRSYQQPLLTRFHGKESLYRP